MKHRLQRPSVTANAIKFAPFEDVLGISHAEGYASIVVPGAGLANFDTYEANPFESGSQRKEKLIHGLLEKLDPNTISIKVNTVGDIDGASKEVIEKEKREHEEQEIANMKKKEKKVKKKARGRSKIGNKMAASQKQMQEGERDKNKLNYLKEVQRAKVEGEQMDNDLAFLGKHQKEFDPADQMFDKHGQMKRFKKD